MIPAPYILVLTIARPLTLRLYVAADADAGPGSELSAFTELVDSAYSPAPLHAAGWLTDRDSASYSAVTFKLAGAVHVLGWYVTDADSATAVDSAAFDDGGVEIGVAGGEVTCKVRCDG